MLDYLQICDVGRDRKFSRWMIRDRESGLAVAWLDRRFHAKIALEEIYKMFPDRDSIMEDLRKSRQFVKDLKARVEKLRHGEALQRGARDYLDRIAGLGRWEVVDRQTGLFVADFAQEDDAAEAIDALYARYPTREAFVDMK